MGLLGLDLLLSSVPIYENSIKMKNISKKVSAIIVTYNPDMERLRLVVGSTVSQVADVVIVDNGSPTFLCESMTREFGEISILIMLRENLGLACAQNRGIALAQSRGASQFLLLDQDSIPAEGMVQELISAQENLSLKGYRIAAVGPRCVDQHHQTEMPLVSIGRFHNKKVYCSKSEGADYIKVDLLISSGSLITTEALLAIGGLREDLFIDNVDLEWCFRARQAGFGLFVSCRATLNHALGDRLIRFWFLRRWIIGVHPSIRLYYMMRNRVYLYFQVQTPVQWIAHDLSCLVGRFLLSIILISPRGTNLSMMVRGIWDGLRHRLGPYEGKYSNPHT